MPSIRFTMLGAEIEVRYCEKHFLAMKAQLDNPVFDKAMWGESGKLGAFSVTSCS
jgi:hypothetical protein